MVSTNSFDCSGLIFTVSREAIGVQLPRTTRALFNFCKDVDDKEREAGDLVFFKTTSSGEVSHVGLYIGSNQFIHAASDGMRKWLWQDLVNVPGAYSMPLRLLVGYSVIVMFGVFTVCSALDFLRIRFIERPLFKLFK